MKFQKTVRRVALFLVVVVALVGLASLTGAGRASAATFAVTNLSDNGGINPAVGAGTGTLRQALVDANANPGDDTITFQAGLSGTITLAAMLPQITGNLTISGPGAGVLTVSGTPSFVVLTAALLNISTGVTASISGLTISGGISNFGGGIHNAGELTVTDSTFSNNSTNVDLFSFGGGILNVGDLTVTNCTFSNNSSHSGGGIWNDGSLAATNCTFSDNYASQGGGIGNNGLLTVTNCTFSGNSAGSGGGIWNRSGLTVTNCAFSNNFASSGGGGIFNYMAIENPMVTDTTFSNNVANEGGGGIWNGQFMTVTNCTFSSNFAPLGGGGGIWNIGTMTATISTFSGNSAGSGGGIYNARTLTVNHSTFSNNSAVGGFDGGGGIYNLDRLTVNNSTFSGNSTVGGGGGIYNHDRLTVNNSTISGNTAFDGGGIYTTNNLQRTNLESSIVANNTAHFGPDIFGFPQGNYNLVENTANAFLTGSNNITGVDPLLGPLQDNSGPTQTHALLCGSPAIDKGISSDTLTTDQRGTGFARLFDYPSVADAAGGDATDIGAFELGEGCPYFTACPLDITVSAAPAQCTAPVSFAATATGDPSPTVVCKVGDTVITSPHTFPVGTTPVVCTATSAAGSATCEFSVTVKDAQPPALTCPANLTQDTDPGQCSAVVSYTTPAATDACSDAPVSCTPPSGSAFPKGTTTVTCTATDAGGNTGECSFTVTVNDTQPPHITCPTNLTVPNTTNQCGAAVNYSVPTVNDNCPGMTVNCSPVPGSTFPVGTTTVTCTGADAAGNTAQCSFTVTVNDAQPPAISCPAAVTGVEPTGPAGAVVNYPPPVASDNCPGVGTPTCAPPAGSTFPIGTTTVTCSVSDASGNPQSCSFPVTVLTPAQAIQALISRVQQLVAAGVLNPPQGTGLIAKLRDALDGLNRGNTRVACNKLADFISQVSAFVGNGMLTPNQAGPLLQSATNIRGALGCS